MSLVNQPGEHLRRALRVSPISLRWLEAEVIVNTLNIFFAAVTCVWRAAALAWTSAILHSARR